MPRPTSLTTLIFALYVLIVAILWSQSSLPKVPDDPSKFHLNFSQAYLDLHHIASRPHPYNSHANDEVRSYILKRLREITEGFAHIQVDDDRSSKATWIRRLEAASFEGLNVLVKVEGTEEEYEANDGVLFSAHFDSVSSGPGVTDDTISIVSLLAFVEYLTTYRVKRTAVFNFNNGEEDGLNGAHAFLAHPWSKIPSKFLNLEGAGAGGRPLLFRSTSLSPVHNYVSAQPHGSIITADAFLRGVVRSGTDFTVYMNGHGPGTGMEGLDIAFYEGRAWYHTMHDSLRGAQGARESLWAMMRTVKDTGIAMLNEEEAAAAGVKGVYFDIFGKWFVLTTQTAMLRFSTSLMLFGPMALWAIARYASQTPKTDVSRPLRRMHSSSGLQQFLVARKHHCYFWYSLILTICAQALLAFTIYKCNPYIVHSRPYTLLISNVSLVYLTSVSFLRKVPGGNRQSLALQLYFFTYLLNAAGVYVLHHFEIGGIFPVVIWHFCALLGCAVGYFGDNGDEAAAPRARSSDGGEKRKRRKSVGEGEKAPLVAKRKRRAEKSAMTYGRWWFVQALVLIPVPVTLLMQILLLFLVALGQTLSDGSSPLFIYAATALLSTLIVLPIVPFTFLIHSNVTKYALLSFVAATVFNFTAFPFTTDAPMKVFFQQRVELLPEGGVKAVTALTGVPGYLDQLVVPELPSTWGKNVSCGPDKDRSRTWTCVWETDLIPSTGADLLPGEEDGVPLSFNVTTLGPASALVHLRGVNTRSCRLYFDNRKVVGYDVHERSASGRSAPSDMDTQPGYEIPPGGVNTLRLYSRVRAEEFVVDVHWELDEEEGVLWELLGEPMDDEDADHEENDGGVSDEEVEVDDRGLKGRVACEWSEYESGTRGMDHALMGSKIPAYEEMLEYLPRWVVVSKLKDGLVEWWSGFEA